MEVKATVADYFAMLRKEILGIPYNKSQHRRQLLGLLQHRSPGAVERKHQNISAILIEQGFVYLAGYKPLRNYQQLLQFCVTEHLKADHNIKEVLCEQVAEPAVLPAIDDILASRINTPEKHSRHAEYRHNKIHEKPQVRKGIDYIAMEANNLSLGSAGEEFVVTYETARLIHIGQERLAAEIEQVSRTRGDGLGYDVLSFDENGRERLIEVKTTAYGPYTPFFVTPNEVAVSRDKEERYYIYRVFNFRKQPKLFTRQGSIDRAFELKASEFEARIL